MYSMTKNALTTTLAAALLAGLFLNTTAFAGEAALTHNEIAAQAAIAGSTDNSLTVASDSISTLAHNEDAAQRAILDTSAPVSGNARIAMGEATLTRNELAARRSIVDLSGTRAIDVRRANAAPVATTSPVSAR